MVLIERWQWKRAEQQGLTSKCDMQIQLLHFSSDVISRLTCSFENFHAVNPSFPLHGSWLVFLCLVRYTDLWSSTVVVDSQVTGFKINKKEKTRGEEGICDITGD